MNDTHLPERLQKLIDLGESGTDLMHGELKNLMLACEDEMLMNNTLIRQSYLDGALDAYTHLYQLTYQLAFAINDRAVKLTSLPTTDTL